MKSCQQKEPLIPHDILSGPWEQVGIDIFQYGSHDCLLVADYFSNFPLVSIFNKQMVAHMVDILRTVSTNHGILAGAFTDQGRKFTSAEF